MQKTILLLAVLLIACSESISEQPTMVSGLTTQETETPEAPETIASTPPELSAGESQTGTSEELLYFWPTGFPDKITVVNSKSYADEEGYELTTIGDELGAVTAISGGAAEERYGYCDESMRAETIEIRGEDGCYSLGTGAGAGVQWKEKGNRYGIGGIGNSLEHVLQVSENLEVLDLEVWQQRLAEAEKFDEEGKY